MSWPHVAIGDRLGDEAGNELIELAPPLQCPPLDVRAAVHAHQQRDVWQPIAEHVDAAADELLESIDGASTGCRDVISDGEQAVESPIEGEPEQLLLAGDVVVDRRLADAEAAGHVLHPRAVVAAFVEHLDRPVEDGLEVVAGPPATSCPEPLGVVDRHQGVRPSGIERLWPRNSAITVRSPPSSRYTVTS